MNAAHHAKYRKEKEPELYQELRLLALEIRDHLAELDGWRQTAVYDQNHIEEVRGQLFSIEGRAAHKFNVTAKPLWLRPVLANRATRSGDHDHDRRAHRRSSYDLTRKSPATAAKRNY